MAIDSSKHGLQCVIIFKWDGVKFVIVTSRAMNADSQEGGHDGGDHVISVQILGELFIEGTVLNAHLGTFIPWAGCQETCGNQGLRIMRFHGVPCDLFQGKCCVGFVCIE